MAAANTWEKEEDVYAQELINVFEKAQKKAAKGPAQSKPKNNITPSTRSKTPPPSPPKKKQKKGVSSHQKGTKGKREEEQEEEGILSRYCNISNLITIWIDE